MTREPRTTLATEAEASVVHVERETRRFVEVARLSPLGAHVPTYPAFTVESLAGHIGRALRIFHTIIVTGGYQEDQVIPAPEGPGVVEWVEAALDPLLVALENVPADRTVSFPHGAGDRPAYLVGPLLAVEVGVHRWDVESVLGDHAPIPPELAVGAIDKVFENFAPRLAGNGVAPIGGVVRFEATDADMGWGAFVDHGHLHAGRLTPDSPEADVVIAAPVADVALIVWKRWLPPRPGVNITGRGEVLQRFLSVDYIPDPRTTPAH
jgi:uncharacterized protein (TIGR03083 family)